MGMGNISPKAKPGRHRNIQTKVKKCIIYYVICSHKLDAGNCAFAICMLDDRLMSGPAILIVLRRAELSSEIIQIGFFGSHCLSRFLFISHAVAKLGLSGPWGKKHAGPT